MKYLGLVASFVLGLGALSSVQAQGLGGGGYGGGGMGGQLGGGGGGPMSVANQQQHYKNVTESIDNSISSYLDTPEVRSILTPGEFCEWKLELTSGQVVIADAKSEMFDPGLQVVDSAEKVVAENDDRYPGDQRPLLLYRCTTDGTYNLRVRCYKNKSGGSATIRFRVFDTIDSVPDKAVQKTISPNKSYLIRMPMKAGQFQELVLEGFQSSLLVSAISPVGLPVSSSSQRKFTPLYNTVIAPVDGDYYYSIRQSHGDGQLTFRTRDIAPKTMAESAGVRTGTGTIGNQSVWRVPVKAGELLEFSAPELYYQNSLSIWEEPDFKSFDLSVPEKNPFYPAAKAGEAPMADLECRQRDGRYQVRSIKKDTVLWVYTNGGGAKPGDYTVTVKPAASKLEDGKRLAPRLAVGSADYWEFEAAIGDVLSLDVAAAEFLAEVEVLNPYFSPVIGMSSDPDLSPIRSTMTATVPGRYLVKVKSSGNGGGGVYKITRKVYPPKVLAMGKPATGEISKGEVHVWKVTIQPSRPIILRQFYDMFKARLSIVRPDGIDTRLYGTDVDANNRYVILSTIEPTTYLLVVYGPDLKTSYKLELLDLPGLAEPKK